MTDKARTECKGTGPFQTFRARRFLDIHWNALHTIQIFLQQGYFLEDFFSRGMLSPSTVILTIRYTDWMWWKQAYPVWFNSEEVQAHELPSSVDKIVVEFEVIEAEEQKLRALLRSIFENEEAYRWPRKGGKFLRIVRPEEYVKEWRWDGPTKLEGQSFKHHPEGDTMTRVVKAVTWEV